MKSRAGSAFVPYLLALLAIVAAVGMRYVLDGWLGDDLPLVTLYGAVAFAAWIGGAGPAILAAGVGFLVCHQLFMAPRGSLVVSGATNLIATLAYALSCGLLIGFAQAMRSGQSRLEKERARLRQSDEFHQAIADLAADFAWGARVEPDGTIVTEAVTEGFTRHLGFTLEALRARGGWGVLVHPDDRAEAERAVARALAGETISGQIRQITKDGRVRWIDYTTKPMIDARGRVVRLYGGSRDVTEQREAAEQVRRAAEDARTARDRFEAVLAGLTSQFIVLDRDWRCAYVNQRVSEETGRPPEDLCGRRFWDVFPEFAGGPVERAARQAMEARCAMTVEHRHPGSNRWFELRLSPAAEGLSLLIGDITERKHAEDALRASEERFRSLITLITNVPWVTDGAGAFSVPQPAWEAYTGQQPEEARGFGWLDALHPDDRRRVAEQWRQCCADRSLYRVECRLWHAAGQRWRHVVTTAMPLLNDDGTLREWVGTCTDIEDRKEAERVQREGEEQLRLAKNAAQLGIHDYDPATGALHWDGRVRELWGIGPDEPTSYDVFIAGLHPDDRDAAQQAVDGALDPDGDGRFFAQYRVIGRDDGIERWVEATGTTFFEAGRAARLVGTVRDITAQKRRELNAELLIELDKRIANSRDPDAIVSAVLPQLHRHLATTSCALHEIDPEHDAGLSRPAWSTRGEHGVGPQPFADFVAPAMRAALQRGEAVSIPDVRAHEWTAGFASRYAARKVRAFLVAPHVRDGELVATLSATCEQARQWRTDEVEILRGAIARLWPAVERARSEELLREADARKDAFLATLAHELRNPLAPLRHMLEVLKRSDDDRERRRIARETMDRQLDHMVRLVDDLLDLGRITRNKLSLRRRNLQIAAVIQQAVETARPLAEAAGHEIEVRVPQEPIVVDGDAIRLVQVFGNLLNNACKYTPAGGHITVAAVLEEGSVAVSVRDDGIGMPRHLLSQVFEPFIQLDGSGDQSHGGLGIGLTLVRRLVEMHGGQVEAWSGGPGQGSEFRVRLPARAAPVHPQSQEEPARAPRPAAPRRVLVVDDNRDSAESLATLLQLAGHRTEVAYDGVGAVEGTERFRPDIVLLDIGLPRLSGLEACRRIRERPWGREVVLIALTGWGLEDDRRRSKEAGFDGHLVKPVSPAALLELIGSIPGGQVNATV